MPSYPLNWSSSSAGSNYDDMGSYIRDEGNRFRLNFAHLALCTSDIFLRVTAK